MAKISARGATALAQITASKSDEGAGTKDGLVHLTLAVTSDGRILRKITLRWKGGNYGGNNYTVAGHMHPDAMASYTPMQFEESLKRLARKWGYA